MDPLKTETTITTPKAIQATTQDVGYYAHRGPNLSKSLCSLHHRVSELVDPLPTILLLRVSLSRLGGKTPKQHHPPLASSWTARSAEARVWPVAVAPSIL